MVSVYSWQGPPRKEVEKWALSSQRMSLAKTQPSGLKFEMLFQGRRGIRSLGR